jgi:dipeptidyl aminopeptidase/acylaminoacyl peptidase
MFAAANNFFQSSSFDVEIGTLDAEGAVVVGTADSSATYAAGHIFYLRGQQVVAQPIDLASGRPRGSAFAIGESTNEGLMPPPGNGVVKGSDHTLVWHHLERDPSPLAWFDRQGQRGATFADATFQGSMYSPTVSPNGADVAVHRQDPQTGAWDIWVLRHADTAPTRLTYEPGRNTDPVWSPDGRQIAYQSQRGARFALYRRRVDGGDTELLLQGDRLEMIPTDWSPDGQHLLYTKLVNNASSPVAIWALPLFGDRVPIRVTEEGVSAYGGRFSPDGRWLAYSSFETGQAEIYVRAFPPTSNKYQISANGGVAHPRWRRDGKELFFWGVQSLIFSAPVSLGTIPVRTGPVKPVFSLEVSGLTDLRSHYDIAPDGGKFIFRAGSNSLSSIVVLHNWSALLPKARE